MKITMNKIGAVLQSTPTPPARKEVKVEQLQQAFLDVAAAFGGAIAARDAYTAGHQISVAKIAVEISSVLGISGHDLLGIQLGALLHDIGKIGVPLEYLTKTTRLTDPEMTMMKLHPEIGFNILKNVEMPWPVRDIIHQHHERLDGSGYPFGLSGDDIVPEAQIIAVADAVDAMLNPRPYRGPLSVEYVRETLAQERGTRMDAEAVDACLSILGDGTQWMHQVGVEVKP